MWLPFWNRARQEVRVHLYVELGFQSGRLADLVQLLAESGAIITGLVSDRSLYPLGMPERYTEVEFLAKTLKHKTEILDCLSAKGFSARELVNRHR